MSTSAIRALMDKADGYPNADRVGFGMNRDQLIALLQECTPLLQSISVVPHHVGNGTTSFTITTYVSFDRSELGVSDADVG